MNILLDSSPQMSNFLKLKNENLDLPVSFFEDARQGTTNNIVKQTNIILKVQSNTEQPLPINFTDECRRSSS